MPLVSDTTYPAAMERIAKARSLVVDLETSGLRPYLGDRLLGIAVCNADTDEPGDYFSFRHAGPNLSARQLTMLLDLLTDGRALCGHNMIRFDCPMLAMEGERYYRALLHDDRVPKSDTIIDAMLANENEPSFSLDALGQKYLGSDAALKRDRQAALMTLLATRNPDTKAKRVLMGRMASLTGAEVADYAIGDVEDCRALRRLYVPHHAEWGLETLAGEMYRYARLLAKIERRGLLIDQAEAGRRIERCEAEREQLGAFIRAQLGLPTFNPQSPAQVCKLLGTSDAEAKTVRRTGHPLAEQLITFKQLGKMATTYYLPMRDKLDADLCVHPQMNLTRDPGDRGGTRSGRLSCSHPNFQNLPKRSPNWWMRVRELVLARPGHVLGINDYDKAEMWMGGHYSGDVSLAEAYHAGRDLYVELSAQTETDRQGAKIDWLAIQYGARGRKLSEMHGWPFKSVKQLEKEFGKPAFPDPGASEWWGHDEWSVYKAQKGPQVVDAFFELCPGIKLKMQELEGRAQRVGCMRLWTGRVVHVDGVLTPPFVMWNRLVQGGVGEMMRVAMQRLEPVLDHYGASMLLQVHDEIVTETPEERVAAVAAETRRIMCDFDFRLRPRVDQKIARTYGNPQDLTKEAA